MLLKFLLGGEVFLAARARSVALTHVHRANVGAEVAPAAERHATLLALEGEPFAVGVFVAGLVRLVAAKVAQPFVAGCGATGKSTTIMEPSAAEGASSAPVVVSNLLVATITAGSGH